MTTTATSEPVAHYTLTTPRGERTLRIVLTVEETDEPSIRR